MAVKQNKNNLFPIEFTKTDQLNAAVLIKENSIMWHDSGATWRNQEFLNLVERQSNHKLKNLRIDRGGEYTGPSVDMMNKFSEDMHKSFETSNLGQMSYFLGLEIKQDLSGIHICQRKYVEDLLKSYIMFSCKPSITPLNSGYRMNLYEDSEPVDINAYRKLIGKLIFVT
ncbi:uncharacterized mitochondrial protein AtMg00810-like [Dioscorea cayenensis subsp. rotundata]|uniref:Uncharacterized mitochondrial protein AtMg00810-like n=1 Tax=Dioscorea cayennensis subsp. rotundata TaxID=55577 RepID=A0AB40BJ70_DIOCR|nr:uncharacterized mitochondrial protein AtMg00810-like [Dioscorea cayenensis subsp. rotundata]